MRREVLDVVRLGAILGACLLLFSTMATASPRQIAGTARVIDGDTLSVAGAMVRLEGIDAPELTQRCAVEGGSWRAGDAARAYLAQLVSSKPVTCTGMGEDKYGRLIARCHANGRDLGAQLVREGLAWAFVRYSKTFVGQEAVARRARVGIWRAQCAPAWSYRRSRWSAEAAAAPDGCAIKGNVSQHGRIYHMPWDRWYGRTRIDPTRGERWFCDEREAREAGWRRAAS